MQHVYKDKQLYNYKVDCKIISPRSCQQWSITHGLFRTISCWWPSFGTNNHWCQLYYSSRFILRQTHSPYRKSCYYSELGSLLLKSILLHITLYFEAALCITVTYYLEIKVTIVIYYITYYFYTIMHTISSTL